jgi:hypothetical protein
MDNIISQKPSSPEQEEHLPLFFFIQLGQKKRSQSFPV